MRERVAIALVKLQEFLNPYEGEYFNKTPQTYLDYLEAVKKKVSVSEFRDPMKYFVEHKLSAQQFKELYLEAFNSDRTGVWVLPLQNLLETTLKSVNVYNENNAFDEELAETKLRQEVAEALAKLDKFLRESKSSYYIDPSTDMTTLQTRYAQA